MSSSAIPSLLSAREQEVLRALIEATKGGNRVLVRTLNLPGSAIGWGRTLGALRRRGYVDAVYPSMESAGVPLVWWPTDAGREALS